jgi:hypothetical protein
VDASIITALAALAGATIGGLMTVLSSWLTQRTQARAQWLAQDKARRQELYRDFIVDASKCYIDALQHGVKDVSGLVGVHALIGRMRVLSSPAVVACADKIAYKILDTYLEPNRSFAELRDMANRGSIDLFSDFAEACRLEFQSLREQQF